MQYFEQPRYRFGFGGGYITDAVKYLVFANGFVFLVQQLFKNQIIAWFGLIPNEIYSKFHVWQLVSYMFLHGDFLHILLNMFILWMFGCEVERHWGFREFLKYYFICGVGAGLFHVVLHSEPDTPVIGASGAIYGILAAFAVIFPDRPIMLFPFFITLKAKHWVLLFLGITILFGISGSQDGIAHFAHLGGMLIGFIYLKLDWKIYNVVDFFKRKNSERKLLSLAKQKRKLQQLRNEVDLILDKINDVGYENLTEDEKKTLKEASDLFSKE